jgi:hypothetical protein
MAAAEALYANSIIAHIAASSEHGSVIETVRAWGTTARALKSPLENNPGNLFASLNLMVSLVCATRPSSFTWQR